MKTKYNGARAGPALRPSRPWIQTILLVNTEIFHHRLIPGIRQPTQSNILKCFFDQQNTGAGSVFLRFKHRKEVIFLE